MRLIENYIDNVKTSQKDIENDSSIQEHKKANVVINVLWNSYSNGLEAESRWFEVKKIIRFIKKSPLYSYVGPIKMKTTASGGNVRKTIEVDDLQYDTPYPIKEEDVSYNATRELMHISFIEFSYECVYGDFKYEEMKRWYSELYGLTASVIRAWWGSQCLIDNIWIYPYSEERVGLKQNLVSPFESGGLNDFALKAIYSLIFKDREIDPSKDSQISFRRMDCTGIVKLGNSSRKSINEFAIGDILYANYKGELVSSSSERGIANRPIGICVQNCRWGEPALFMGVEYLDPYNPGFGSKRRVNMVWSKGSHRIVPVSTRHSEEEIMPGEKATHELLQQTLSTSEYAHHYGSVPNKDGMFIPIILAYRYHTIGTKCGDWFIPSQDEAMRIYHNYEDNRKLQKALNTFFCSRTDEPLELALWTSSAGKPSDYPDDTFYRGVRGCISRYRHTGDWGEIGLTCIVDGEKDDSRGVNAIPFIKVIDK